VNSDVPDETVHKDAEPMTIADLLARRFNL